MKKILLTVCSLLLLSACSNSIATPGQDDVAKIKQYNKVATTSKTMNDPIHGEEVEFWYGAMTGAGGTNANGVALIHKYKDGVSSVTVNLNIVPVEKPSYFTAVLKNDTTSESINLGQISSIVGDARHSVVSEVKEDTASFLHVVVMVHKDKNDVGTVVAEGYVKKPTTATK